MYSPQIKIFVEDEHGNKLSCTQAAEILSHLGYNDQQIRYHVRAHGVKTLKELEEIKQNIIKDGSPYKRVLHDTPFGKLTLKQMHAIHPDKENLKRSALSSRIAKYGPGSDRIWEPANNNPARTKPIPKTKECLLCGRKREAKFYRMKGKALSIYCVDCDGKSVEVKPEKKKQKPTREGDVIWSGLQMYKVVSVFGKDVTCHRLMDNGQVLKRTLIYMPAHKIQSQQRSNHI